MTLCPSFLGMQLRKLRKLREICVSCVICAVCVILRNLRKMQFTAYVCNCRQLKTIVHKVWCFFSMPQSGTPSKDSTDHCLSHLIQKLISSRIKSFKQKRQGLLKCTVGGKPNTVILPFTARGSPSASLKALYINANNSLSLPFIPLPTGKTTNFDLSLWACQFLYHYNQCHLSISFTIVASFHSIL